MNTVFYPVKVMGPNGEVKGEIKERHLKLLHWKRFEENAIRRRENNIVFSEYEDENNRLASRDYRADYQPRHNHNYEASHE